MAQLSITKTYVDGVTPTQADFDNICDSLETFLNSTKLGSDNIASSSIDASAVFATASITEGKIASSAVTTTKIADNAVTSAKIADGAVTTGKIVDAAVTAAKIADGTVTAAKVADGAITHTEMLSSQASSGTTATSTGSESSSTAASTSGIRPIIYCGGGAGGLDITLTATGTASAAYAIKKDSITVANNALYAAPLADSGSISTFIRLPSSCLFYLDLIELSSTATRTYAQSVTELASGTATTSGGNNAGEVR
jgi:hypothetical protein